MLYYKFKLDFNDILKMQNRAACTSMCPNKYTWNIVNCDIKLPINQTKIAKGVSRSYLLKLDFYDINILK